jgi:hypothetical protein
LVSSLLSRFITERVEPRFRINDDIKGGAMNTADWLARIERERLFWEDLVAEVGEENMGRPGASGDWTFRDVAAHLNAWRRRTVARLEAAAANEEAPSAQWPAGYDEETDDGVDAINRWFYELYRNQTTAQILAETREQFDRMKTAVELIPEADFATPGRYAWLPGHPLSAVLEGSFEHLHEEHEPLIRAWLSE